MAQQAPLAERMRPQSLAEYVGQPHLIGQGAPLMQQLSQGSLPSMIMWGPPGTGKTTLAQLLAKESKRPFYALSAVEAGVKEIRSVLESAKKSNSFFQNEAPVLFIDELHRFSKSQQDALLHAVEKGHITLIGATTENPGFEVINALLSRCQVYTLQSLEKAHLLTLLERSIQKDPLLLQKQVQLLETDALIAFSGGDARKLLNLLEMAVLSSQEVPALIDNALVEKVAIHFTSAYDKKGEFHYDTISAFIKSVRGSDPHAALYWLARMLQGGEDPLFVARRILILASEDIGLANPNALLMANACFQTVSVLGMPEARIVLGQCVVYLATSPKSNSAYNAINKAMEMAAQTSSEPIPLHLRNAPVALMKELNYGVGYKYSHDYPGHFAKQEFMPDSLKNTSLYQAADNPKERELKSLLEKLWGDKYEG
jgi:putative ATPase